MTSGDCDLVILDEVNSSAHLGIVSEQEVLAMLDCKAPHTEVICTGRNAPKSFIEKADLVSEICLQKHYFYKGTKARRGIDF